MSTDALIGHTGFVGSNLAAQHSFSHTYNSTNIAEIAGRTFDRLVFSGAQSKKWWANQNPADDRAGIERALAPLQNVTADRCVLISTVDVIPPQGPLFDERVDCHAVDLHAYGANRLFLEDRLRDIFPKLLIVRLPALFGPGLAKNVIFDLMNDNMLDKINPASRFQYYDLTRLWTDIGVATEAELKLVHLFTEPVATSAVIEKFFAGKFVGSDQAPEAHYDFRTCHGPLFGGKNGYIEDGPSVLLRMGAFIAGETYEAKT